jgi:splicing factor 3B subunit 1
LQYVLQGLFHPARKVREVYWRIYNMIYMGHQDALVPVFPVLPNEAGQRYSRPELEVLF